jgi:hypothetical protein
MTNHSENLNSKITIKLGKLEIEFSGSEDYIRNGLPELIDLLSSYSSEDCEDDDDNTVPSSVEEAEELPENPDPAKRKLQMTTNSISARLAAKTGPDLVLAACAHLTLVKGADTFERKNILAEMQTASNYYTKNYSSNLSKYLISLVKDNKLIERSQNTYALSANCKQEMESLLQ